MTEPWIFRICEIRQGILSGRGCDRCGLLRENVGMMRPAQDFIKNGEEAADAIGRI